MKTYTFGLFVDGDLEPVECVTLGINCAVTAHSLLTSMHVTDKSPTVVSLMQEVQKPVSTYHEHYNALIALCVPYFIAYKDTWPEDEWITLTPSVDLQLSTEEGAEGFEVRRADVYTVTNKQTDGNSGILIFHDNVHYLSAVIKQSISAGTAIANFKFHNISERGKISCDVKHTIKGVSHD